MRIFVPTTIEELFLAVPPSHEGVTLQVDRNLTADEIEIAHEEAIDEAAFRSLSLVIDSSRIRCRVVLVGQLMAAPENKENKVSGWTSWKQVESLHVDSPESQRLVAEIAAADNQEVLDQKVSELFEQSLEWFDISELDDLRKRYAETDQGEGTIA